MATQTLSSADAILKELYVGPIVEQLNQKSYCLDQIERDSDHIDFTGRRAIVPVHKSRNRGRKSIADGGVLPTAGTQGYLDAIVPVKDHAVGIEITDKLIKASKSNNGAFIAALTAETKGAATDMRKDINRQVFGRGNGALCKVKGVDKTSKTTNLKFVDFSDMQYIFVGDVIDVLVESTGATTNGVVGAEVTERSVANKEVTLSVTLAAELAAETYQVYISGNRGNEMDGLRNITEAERTLHSINSATAGNQFWNGNTQVAGATAAAPAVASETLFIQLADAVGAQGNGDVEVFLTSRGIKRRLAESYASQKRFNDTQAVNVHGGYSAIMVNEIPVVADDDAPKGYAFGLNKSALKWFELAPPEWLELENGGIFHLKVNSAGTFSNVWQAYFIWYAALGSVAPNRTGRIEFCTDDKPVSNG